MKITKVETFIVGAGWRNLVFVKVHTDEGISGIGEASLRGKENSIVAIIQMLEKRHLIGWDPFDTERLIYEIYRNDFDRGGPILPTALSGIEIACWDIIGKSLGVPIYKLLGGQCHEKIKAYANGWYGGARTPENFAERAKNVVKKGYKAMKFDPFGLADREPDSIEIRKSIEVVQAVRQAVGQDIDIIIEGHGRFGVRSAIEIGKQLEPYNPLWYEEPIPPDNIDALLKVRQNVNVPLSAGERAYNKYQFQTLINSQAVEVLQPDVIHMGGLLEAKKIAAMADAQNISLCPHNCDGPVLAAASVHLDACSCNFFIQEMFVDFDVPWMNDLIDNPIEVKDGCIDIPDKPGLGMELREDQFAKHPLSDNTYSCWGSGWSSKLTSK